MSSSAFRWLLAPPRPSGPLAYRPVALDVKIRELHALLEGTHDDQLQGLPLGALEGAVVLTSPLTKGEE